MTRCLKIKRPDTEEIRGLIKAFCEETKADEGQYESIVARLSTMHIFAAMESSIVAVGGYYSLGEKAIFDFIYVLASYRDKNIAGRLHRMATRHAQSIGMKTTVVFARPDTARRYLKIGYQEKFRVLERGIAR